MASEVGCEELLARLGEVVPIVKAIKRDLPFTGPRAGIGLLFALRRCGQLRMGQLAEWSEVDQSVISRHVAELEERGWVERVPNPHDGRSWHVRLAPEGERVTDETIAYVRRMFASTLDDWTDEEVAELSGLLGRLRTSFHAHRARAEHLPRTAQTVKGH
ncbi:MarR family winged helix-turn-helix transcriptional regulator [Sphaerisporangium perillae]|uniref:MarR family winged helix-turn-helix transcriptional regulator n=1 Tax=Sphaerisporangium perillae TaxID=2935860 RepID=UPI00200BC752|nr:MarR family winged helix-turn-helix transcriptional regulator [Sphaerisporangium perillae]